MIINWEGKAYSLDFADLTLKQAETIEAESGLSIDAWLDSLENPATRLKFIKLAYWLMLAQNGEDVPAATVDFKLIPFGTALGAAFAAAPAPAAEPGAPGPTRPSPVPVSASPPAPLSPVPSANGTEVPAAATVS